LSAKPGFEKLIGGDNLKSLHLGIAFTLLLLLSVAAAAKEEGTASYYADSLQGNSTASGEPYDRNELTAAHRTLEFGTRVRVTNRDNGKSVVVRVNDRGPHAAAYVIDVSGAAAERLGMLETGTAEVSLEVLD